MKNRNRRRWWVLCASRFVGLGMLLAALGTAADAAEPPSTATLRPAEPPPARVQLSTFEALDAGGQVLVRWETSLEWGVLTFDLFRQTDGQWQRVNTQPVIAQLQLTGGAYQVLDPEAPLHGANRYRLVASTLAGQNQEVAIRQLPVTGQAGPADLAGEFSRPRVGARPAAVLPEPSRTIALASPSATVDLTSSDARVKIRTSKAGLHFVKTSDLAAVLGDSSSAGIQKVQGWITDGSIQMSNQGQGVKYVPGTSGGVNGLFFYAESHRNNYTAANVYWIQGGSTTFEDPIRLGTATRPPSQGHYWAIREDFPDRLLIHSFVTDPEDDFLMSQGLFSGTGTDTWTASGIPLTRLVRGSTITGTIEIPIYRASYGTHILEVKINGSVLGEVTLSGPGPSLLTLDAPSTVLKDATLGEGLNEIMVRSLLPVGDANGLVFIDGYRLKYRRAYWAGGGFLEATTDGNTVIDARGFTSSSIWVLNVTDPRSPRKVEDVTIDAPVSGGTERRATFRCGTTDRYFLFQNNVTTSTTAVAPADMSLRFPSDLGNGSHRASYVVVTPASFAAAAQTLATHRSTRLRTMVVLLEDIYDEFNHGLESPQALKSFVQSAYGNWAFPIRYLVLFGDGTYDYRDVNGQHDNIMPPLMISSEYGLVVSDSLYGVIPGDSIPKVAVGRLPIVSETEFPNLLAKIQSYEAEAPLGRLKALLVADRPDSAGDFVAAINVVEGYLAARYDSQKVYPEPYPLPGPGEDPPPPVDVNKMRTGIQVALNDGVDLMNYVGHGSAVHLGTYNYLGVEDVPTLSNSERLPILAAMTCVAGQFSNPGYDCLAEAMVMGQDPTEVGVGAVASIAPSGLSYDADAQWISRRLMEVLARTTTGRVGDVVVQTFALYERGSPRPTPVWMYNLLGDPALEVLVPGALP